MKDQSPLIKVAHHYIGCEFVVTAKDGVQYYDVMGVVSNQGEIFGIFGLDYYGWAQEKEGTVQLLLINPEDISDEQQEHYYTLSKKRTVAHETIKSDTPESIHYLLECGFDIFGLIEKGLAIEKKYFCRDYCYN